MIARLTGKIDELKATEVILDIAGVGYLLTIPLSTYDKILSLNEVTLQVYTHHKEDTFRLFGFYTAEEKDLFTLLISISGIGPSMAISIISGISIESLVSAVQEENTSILVKIPGIGKNKAEKLIFELKRKLGKLEISGAPDQHKSHVRNDSLDALLSLGFDEKKASEIIDTLINETPDITLEKLVKESLKSLSG